MSPAPVRPGRPDPRVRRRWVAVDHPGWTQAHASTVVAHDGDVVAAWFAGTREGTPDNRVWLARRGPGTPWGDPVVVDAGDVARWNPVLARGPGGESDDLWLFLRRGARISEWSTWVRRSPDGGRTWSGAVELVPGDVGGRGPVKNPPVVAPDGAWLAPGSTEEWGERPRWQPFVDRSEDGGRTWTLSPIPLDRARLRGAGAIQPALWVAGGQVHALLRSTEGHALRSSSTDDGRTWPDAEPTDLPSNNSGLAVMPLPRGRVACVHNPVAGDWAARCPLVVSVSDDDGRTWRQVVTVEDGVTPVADDPLLVPSPPPPAPALEPADGGVGTDGAGEYSYPAAVVVRDTLLITYTWQRRGIVEALVPLETLTSPAEPLSDTEGRP